MRRDPAPPSASTATAAPEGEGGGRHAAPVACDHGIYWQPTVLGAAGWTGAVEQGLRRGQTGGRGGGCVRTLVQRPLVRAGTFQLQRREQLRPQLAVSRRFVARCGRPRKCERPAAAQRGDQDRAPCAPAAHAKSTPCRRYRGGMPPLPLPPRPLSPPPPPLLLLPPPLSSAGAAARPAPPLTAAAVMPAAHQHALPTRGGVAVING